MSNFFVKLMFLIIGLFLVAAAAIVTVRYFLNGGGISDTNKTGDTITIDGSSGGKIKANNPAESTNFDDIGANVYISDERQLGPGVGFSVAYYEDDGSFAIDISGKPTALYRQKAGEYLLETLNISEAEACKLRLYVGVTHTVDPQLSGENLGLSFCPDSVKL